MNPRILILLILALLAFGSTALAAPIYATDVEAYSPFGSVASNRQIEANALGAQNDPGSGGPLNFLSLGVDKTNTNGGYGGYAAFSFAGKQFAKSVTIYETTYNRTGYEEYATLYGSNSASFGDTSSWTLLGTVDNQNVDVDGGSTLDITGKGAFTYLIVVDSTKLNGGTLADGFDIDAVKVSATPLPGALWLLGSGLVGLVGLRRRFSA